MRIDYQVICEKVLHSARRFTLQQFIWARSIVSTRNFGVHVQGSRDDLLVPLADMINHGRPPNCTWAFHEKSLSFLVTAIDVGPIPIYCK
jgi:protein-histidine N-methyltransferase